MARTPALIASALLACALALPAAAAAPRRSWRTLVTPHFRVHFHEGLALPAERLAPIAEDTLVTLVGFLGHAPSAPIHVVLTDETDSANGFAQVLPENVINLFPAVPDPFGSLGDYDDALRILFLHELTHVVHLDTIGGLATVVNAILGKTIAPNQIQPRWFIEGLAVYSESRFSAAGRNRNAMIDMLLREDVLANQFFTIDELTSVTRRFPGGGIQWSYGGRFLGFIASRYGEAALAEISADYGGRIVPYGMNVVSGHVLKKSYAELWDEWRADEEEKTRGVVARVEREGLRAGEPIPTRAEEVYHPALSKTGRLALFEVARDADGALVFFAPDRATELLRLRTSGGRGAFTTDGRRFVATLFDSFEQRFSFMDLEVIDVEAGTRRRRTRGARLDEPDVASDGRVVAVHQEAGQTELVTLTLDGDDEPATIFRPEPGMQVSGPKWSPDGRRLIASLHGLDGGRRIIVLDVSSGTVELATEGRDNDQDPIWAADGRSVIFSSDRGGVFNLHAVDLETHRVERITNVVTGAFQPALAPDGRTVAFVHGKPGGYELRALSLGGPLLSPTAPCARPASTSSGSLARFPSENYVAWESLLPKAWFPSFGTNDLGSTYGVFITGQDAIAAHAYQLTVHYGVESRRLGYSVQYTNRQLPTPITLSSSLVSTRRPGGFVAADGTFRPESIFRVRAGIDLPFGHWDASTGVGLSYGVELRRGLRLYSDDPFQYAPSAGDADTTLASLGLSFRFSTVRSFADSISAATGHAFGMGLEIHDPRLGSDFRILSVFASWSGYLTLPWLHHHVLAARVALGGAAGDARGRSVFVLGGLGVRNVLADAVDNVRVGTDVLRGYPPSALRGNAYYLGSTEYRFPLFAPSLGIATLPAFLDRLYGAAFVDLGDAPVDSLEPAGIRVGVGGELRLDVALGYYLPLTARLGFARGLTHEGVNALYLVLGGLF